MDLDTLPPLTEGLDVEVCDLVIATAERSDPLVDRSVPHVLKLLREQHRIDAAFVAELVEGNRIRRRTGSATASQFGALDADPLELAFCRQAVRPSSNDACYFSAPIVLSDGGHYGKLYACCDSADEKLRERELKKLELTAQLAARLINDRLAQATRLAEAA